MPTKPEPQPPPVSVADAARRTGIPRRTIQEAITRGDLPAYKLGGGTAAYIIEEHDLDSWVADRNIA